MSLIGFSGSKSPTRSYFKVLGSMPPWYPCASKDVGPNSSIAVLSEISL